MAARTCHESRRHTRQSISPTVAMRLLESSLVAVPAFPVLPVLPDLPDHDQERASSCAQRLGQEPSTTDPSSSSSSFAGHPGLPYMMKAVISNLPYKNHALTSSSCTALASVKIRCHQVVETEAQPQESTSWAGPPLPCRVNHGCLWLEWKHFVDGVESIDFDPQGVILSSILECKQDHAIGAQSQWEDYGISRFEIYDQPGAQGAWVRFQSNGLPPVGQYQERTVLRWVVLDMCWATRKIAQDPCGLPLPPYYPEPRGGLLMEAEATSVAFRQIMNALAREHPLVFSPKDMDRFLHITRHNEVLADSICQIYERATHPIAHRKMDHSIKRMRMQYPCVPKNDIRTLVQHALETVAYRLLNKSFKKRHASEARTLDHRNDSYDSLSQEDHQAKEVDGLDTGKDHEPGSQSDFSDIFCLEEDNKCADQEYDQELYIQSEVYRGEKRPRISSEDDLEFFEPLSME